MLGQGCCERKHSRVESCRLGRCIISPHSERAADVVYISSFLPLLLCTGCSPCSTLGFRKQLIIFFFLFLSTNPGKRTNNKEVLLKSPVLIQSLTSQYAVQQIPTVMPELFCCSRRHICFEICLKYCPNNSVTVLIIAPVCITVFGP